MTASITELNAVDRDILRALAHLQTAGDGPVIGADIVEWLNATLYDDAKKQRVYRALDRLVDAGLVQKVRNSPNNRSHSYRVTDEGSALVQALTRHIVYATPGYEIEDADEALPPIAELQLAERNAASAPAAEQSPPKDAVDEAIDQAMDASSSSPSSGGDGA